MKKKKRKGSKVVADGWHTSRYLVTVSWVTLKKGYDVERPETPNEPRLETSLMMCAKATNRCISPNKKNNLDLYNII